MKKKENLRPIWINKKDPSIINIIDQRMLPHKFVVADLKNVDDVIFAIKEMMVRGAPLIGVTGAFGVYLSCINLEKTGIQDKDIILQCKKIKNSRPTAVNLFWAVDKVLNKILQEKTSSAKIKMALKETLKIVDFEIQSSKKIGLLGYDLIKKISKRKNNKTVNILTHCNAGFLATIEYGTATAPIYTALEKNIDIHVFVDETRPLNQGARLTCWELSQKKIKHTIITDNAGGHLMQHKIIDMVIVGTDRTTYTGDVANKIGTYLKALAAKDNNIPFYVALPSSTFDWNIKDGLKQIKIEKRDPNEVKFVQGLVDEKIKNVLICPKTTPGLNYAFDVTPQRLVTGFITERGICHANEKAIKNLFPEKA
ncbi:MAG: S-methyl-5-thioribose-1-phosphate isomerase [Desulfobacteraceae bacterium 4572_130]|nr:MAG: S-methyl-5-thioribose-1-phosphate isomerase [Desulfobacteraceae bacterium 4572_130]